MSHEKNYPSDPKNTMSANVNGNERVTVVGLRNSGNGRSCQQHPLCGKIVQVGSLLRFLLTVVKIEGKLQYAIGAYHVDAGRTTCLVGFLPSKMIEEFATFEDRIGQVTTITENAYAFGTCQVQVLPMKEGVGDGINGYLPDLDTMNLHVRNEKDYLGSKYAAAHIMSLYNAVNSEVKSEVKEL